MGANVSLVTVEKHVANIDYCYVFNGIFPMTVGNLTWQDTDDNLKRKTIYYEETLGHGEGKQKALSHEGQVTGGDRQDKQGPAEPFPTLWRLKKKKPSSSWVFQVSLQCYHPYYIDIAQYSNFYLKADKCDDLTLYRVILFLAWG